MSLKQSLITVACLFALSACKPETPLAEPAATPAAPVEAPAPAPEPTESAAPATSASAGLAATADGKPAPGSHGFNWLDPESPCKEITADDVATMTECRVEANAFGLSLEARACKVDEKVEYIVYATAEQCQEAHETMQANGD